MDQQIVGRGRGPTKKASQQAAAEEALAHLKPADDIDAKFLVAAESSDSPEINGEVAEMPAATAAVKEVNHEER